MKIAVISPFNRVGVSTVAYLLADVLSNNAGKSCTIVSTGNSSKILDYLKINTVDVDITRSPNQVGFFTRQGDGNLDDYSYTINPKLRVLSTWDESTGFTESLVVAKDSYPLISSEVIITDVHGWDLKDPNYLALIDSQDYVLMVTTQDADMLKESLSYLDSDDTKATRKNTGIIVNKFSPEAGSLTAIAKKFRLKKRIRINKLEYTPNIIDYTNNNALKALGQDIREQRYYLIGLYDDMVAICNQVLSNLGYAQIKKEV